VTSPAYSAEKDGVDYIMNLEDPNIKYTHKNSLPLAVLKVIKPIYRDPASPDLLRKFQHGKIQNSNESMNALIWSKCLKKIVGKQTVDTSVTSAISVFHDNYNFVYQTLEHMGVEQGAWSVNI
jgi:hypothetical protein